MSFASILNIFATSLESGNSSSSEVFCDPGLYIDYYLFYPYLCIPSVIEILLMSVFVQRVRMCLHCWKGRPGVVIPMDIFEMENRFSFACTFGIIAYLVYQCVIEQRYVIPFSGHLGYRIIVILLSVLVYGLAYFPVFAALAMKNILSYGLGCLHVWVFAGIGYADTFLCTKYYGIELELQLIARNLPLLFCLTYLSIMLPVRFIKEVIAVVNNKKIHSAETEKSVDFTEDPLQELQNSRYARHLQKNFLPPPLPPKPREGKLGTIINIAMALLRPWIYYRNPEFKYSARFLSVMLVCSMLIYKIAIEFLILFINIKNILITYIQSSLSYIGWENEPGEDPAITAARSYLYLLYYFVESILIVAITATTIEFLLAATIQIHVVSSYRKNLLALHKGDKTHIPPISEKSNASILLGTMRWAGYQVGYAAWAFLIQWLMLFLVFFAIAIIITLIRAGYGYLIVYLIERFWPIPVVTIGTIIIQFLMAKFLFLQDRGEFLGIENRRWFFVITHFLFFYNIFLGLISCLLRIIKAMVIGGLFLGRLDHSTLPRRFQLFDPGFDAYVGFLHMENAHMHPVVLVFIKLLNISVPPRYQVQQSEDKDPEMELGESCTQLTDSKELRKKRARIRWSLGTMLILNPYLIQMRKKYIKKLKEDIDNERERLEKSLEANSKVSKQKPVKDNGNGYINSIKA